MLRETRAQAWQPALAASPPTWEYVPPPGEAPLAPRWAADPLPAPTPQAWEHQGAPAPMASGGAQWSAEARPWIPADNSRAVLVQDRGYC